MCTVPPASPPTAVLGLCLLGGTSTTSSGLCLTTADPSHRTGDHDE
jgi:hypothetical protein